MDEESRQQSLRLLEELVLDAGEAVSYRRLAGALCLHVNRSKALLQEFVDKYETAHQLSISVLVCGTTSNGGACIKLCSRGDLESIRISLKPVLFEHIYAVSRASAALGEAALAAAAGGFDDFTPTIGAISSAVCVKRSQEEIGNLKVNSYKALANDAASVVGTSTKDAKKILKSVLKTEQKHPSEVVTSTPVGDSNNVTKKSSVSAPEPTVKKEVKSISKGTSNNISNFFSKSNGQPAAKQSPKIKEEHIEIKAEPKEMVKEANGSVEKFVTNVTTNQEETPKKKKEQKTDNTANRKTVTSEVKKDSSKKKGTANHKNGKVDKKRKRVVLMSDSEDSEEEKEDPFEELPTDNAIVESDDDDVIPPTPNADVVKITSGIINPKKRRKIVDKTYTTEDGYMVTRKEEVLESCSEDEIDMKENIVEINVKKEIVIEKKTPTPAPKSKKKIPSPQKGKQASIMSFFKKKP